ncbi:MAG: hypothetical protein K8T20_01525 [Planctomycetes bacterium]|nr:hypothetical protein [Planctomycetota bacterium]
MKTAFLLTAFAYLMATGCSTTVNNNDDDQDEVNDGEAHDADSGDCWDGERWVVVVRGHHHGPGCGHYFHSGAWHLHPANFVYVGGRGHHFRVIVHHGRRRR